MSVASLLHQINIHHEDNVYKKLILMKFLQVVEQDGEECENFVFSLESYLDGKEGPNYKISKSRSEHAIFHLLCKWAHPLEDFLLKEIDEEVMYKANLALPEIMDFFESLFGSEVDDWIVNPCLIRRLNIFKILEKRRQEKGKES